MTCGQSMVAAEWDGGAAVCATSTSCYRWAKCVAGSRIGNRASGTDGGGGWG